MVFSIPWQGRGIYLSFHFLSVLFCGQPVQQSRQFCKFSFFFLLLVAIKSGLLAEIRWSVCMSKYYYYYYSFLRVFFFTAVLPGGLSLKSESPQVSKTMFSIFADLNSAVVYMVSILPLIFYSPSPLSNSLETVSNVPTTIGYSQLFSSLARSKYLFIFRLFLFSLCGQPEWQNPRDGKFSFYKFALGLVSFIRWKVYLNFFKYILAWQT